MHSKIDKKTRYAVNIPSFFSNLWLLTSRTEIQLLEKQEFQVLLYYIFKFFLVNIYRWEEVNNEI